MRNFRELTFWQDSKSLSLEIYRLTKNFPKDEVFALSNQLRRASVSIPSNIAEGAGRFSDIDFSRFLDVAIGSCYEVETQLEIAYELGYVLETQKNDLIGQLQSIEKRITVFVNKMRNI